MLSFYNYYFINELTIIVQILYRIVIDLVPGVNPVIGGSVPDREVEAREKDHARGGDLDLGGGRALGGRGPGGDPDPAGDPEGDHLLEGDQGAGTGDTAPPEEVSKGREGSAK